MFDHLFESRDKTITNLIKLGDCLGRSLRENVCIFTIDSANAQVNYLTESGKIITGTYSLDKDIELTNITIQESEVFNNGEVFDGYVKERIGNLVEGIYYSEYTKAEDSFEEVLSLWRNRLKLNSLQEKLVEKRERLALIEKIVDTDQFQKLLEVTPQLQEFLEDNFDKVKNIAEIRNAVNLSNTVSQAFNFPRLSYEDLNEGGSYRLVNGTGDSIYEMICRQELVKKELLESKRDFDTIWATNEKVIALANTVFESDEVVLESLFEALKEVPYLALVSKKALMETITNCLGKADGIGINESDIHAHVARIFEIKKEAKKLFIDSINEKYGVDIQNLKEPPTFKSLVNTQIVIFEALTRIVPKGSVLKQVLSEMGNMLKSKSGVETIDVNDYVFELFSDAGYAEVLVEAQQEVAKPKGKMNLKRIVKNIDNAQSLLGNIKKRVETSVGQMDSEESVDKEALESGLEGGEGEEAPPMEKGAKMGKKSAGKEPTSKPKSTKPVAKPNAQEQVPPTELPPEEGGEVPPEAGIPSKKEDAAAQASKGAVAPNPQDQKRTLEDVIDLENMLADLAAEIGIPDNSAPTEEAPVAKKENPKAKGKPKEDKNSKLPIQEVD
jgi:hypothetical protein